MALSLKIQPELNGNFDQQSEPLPLPNATEINSSGSNNPLIDPSISGLQNMKAEEFSTRTPTLMQTPSKSHLESLPDGVFEIPMGMLMENAVMRCTQTSKTMKGRLAPLVQPLKQMHTARASIERGENVKDVCKRLDITDKQRIFDLQSHAVNSPPVRNALEIDSAASVAAKYGIDDIGLIMNMIAFRNFYTAHLY
jgi:hypothetical protein